MKDDKDTEEANNVLLSELLQEFVQQQQKMAEEHANNVNVKPSDQLLKLVEQLTIQEKTLRNIRSGNGSGNGNSNDNSNSGGN